MGTPVKTFTVSVTFTDLSAQDPLSAAKEACKWLKDGADSMIYDVKDEQTNENYTVDLSEEDEDAVLPDTEIIVK